MKLHHLVLALLVAMALPHHTNASSSKWNKSKGKNNGKNKGKGKNKGSSSSSSSSSDDNAPAFRTFEQPSCQAGILEDCVSLVLNEMEQRLVSLGCDHDSIFAVSYYVTTVAVRDFALALEFDNLESVVREDALFADTYFDAYDAFHGGDSSKIAAMSPVWKFTFDSADTLTSAGNVFLSIVSHIQRDLPLVLYQLDQEGTPVSKADHDKFNQIFLFQDDASVIIRAYYDEIYPPPSADDFPLILGWRETAYLDYQGLVAGTTTVADIEAKALLTAQGLAPLFVDTPEGIATRDAYCATNNPSGPFN